MTRSGAPGAVADCVRLTCPGPLDLRRTVAPITGRFDPCIRVAADGVWRATRTADGPATLHIRERGAGRIEARAWGPGAPAALAGVADLLGFADRPEAFEPSAHPVVAELHRRRPGLRVGRSGAVVEVLVPTVLGQRVTSGEAHRSYRQLVRTFGDPAPGPADAVGLRVPPDPSRLAQLVAHQLHGFGVDGRRAATIIGICRRARSLERLSGLPPGSAAEALRSLPGVGPWTVSIALGVAWGDPDAVVVGDYHLPHTMAWVLAGEARADDTRMLELLAPFAGHRGRAQRLVAGAGHAPRRGPGRRVLDLAHL